MSVLEELLGESVVDGEGRNVNPRDLAHEGAVIGLYFSASWCPPCRMFTNQLVKFYNHVTSAKPESDFKVIFLSSDEDEDDFQEYFAKMPWLAMNFNDREREARLSQHFQVGGIPTLILVDSVSGDVITDRGRALVMEDPTGSQFPWRTNNSV